MSARFSYKVFLSVLLLCISGTASSESKKIETTRFGRISLELPDKAFSRFVLLFSDRAGIDAAALTISSTLNKEGYGVAIIDSSAYTTNLINDGEDCISIAGEIVRLSQMVEIESGVTSFNDPLLVGVGLGGQIARLPIAEASDEFIGLITSNSDSSKLEPLKACVDASPANDELATKWLKVSDLTSGDELKKIKTFIEGLHVEEHVSNSAISDALVELPSVSDRQDYFVLFFSGDGGWATIDKEIGESLVGSGIDVLGVSSLSYFWKAKTKEEAGADLNNLIKNYLEKWAKQKVVLIGFSLGADVLPIMFNQLENDIKEKVAALVLLSPSTKGALEMHITDWFFDNPDNGIELLPEVQKFKQLQTLCVYGQEEKDTICRMLTPDNFKNVELAGDHHFNNDYTKVAELILNFISNK